MEEVRKKVVTEFPIEDRQAMSALGALGGAFEGVGGMISMTTSLVNPLNAAIGTLGAAFSAHTIAHIGKEFENANIAVAGFLSALGFTRDFNEGLTASASTLEKIRVSAAALPGEAEDYIEVFKMGLPFVAHAIHGSLDDMTAFTNRYTAITQTLQIDTAQSARDLQLLLNEGVGRAGMHVKAWTQLLPFMKQVEGQASITAEKFNKMTNVERADLLNKTFGKLDPMLKASASTFDAMWGAIVSNTKMMLRLGSAPLFEGFKSGLEAVNNMLFDANGAMTPLAAQIVRVGEVISDSLVGGFKRTIEFADLVRDKFLGIAEAGTFKPVLDGLNSIIGELGKAIDESSRTGAGGASVGGVAGAIGTGAALMADISGPMMLAVTPLVSGLIEFASHTDAVSEAWSALLVTISPIIDAMGELHNVMGVAGSMVADFLDRTLTQVIEGVGMLLKPVFELASGLFSIVQVVLGHLRPTLNYLWDAIGRLVVAFGEMYGAVFAQLGPAIMNIASLLGDILMPVIDIVVKGFGELIDAITALFKWITSMLPGGGQSAPKQPGAPPRDYLGEFMARFKVMSDEGKGPTPSRSIINKATEAPAGKGVVQDFRYSRFEITQKFAEGYDPDRIAVAFAQDIGRIGEQKLQSGFEPLFALR